MPTGTYSGDPSSSDADWVRWRVGDTTDGRFFQSDDEITAALTDTGNKYLAAARAAEAIAAYFAPGADTTVGKLSISKSQRYDHYIKLAKQLRQDALVRAGGVYAGGLSIAERDTDRNDTDLIQPAFTADFDKGSAASDTGN